MADRRRHHQRDHRRRHDRHRHPNDNRGSPHHRGPDREPYRNRGGSGYRRQEPINLDNFKDRALIGYDELFEKEITFPSVCFRRITVEDVFSKAELPPDAGMSLCWQREAHDTCCRAVSLQKDDWRHAQRT